MNESPRGPWHADREVVEVRSSWVWLGPPLMALELAGAFWLCWVLLERLLLGDCSPGHSCGILYLIVVLPGSCIGSLIVLVAHNLLIRDMGTRVKVDVVLMLTVLFWWNAGQRAKEHEARVEQQQSQLSQALERASEGSAERWARNRFIERLRSVGNHGPIGQVPSMLRVQDDGMEAEVELLEALRTEFPVALARVRPDPAAPGGWRGCPMAAMGAQAKNGAYLLHPGQPVRFTPAVRCADAFRGVPLEFRLGSWQSSSESPGWWSDSAIAVPDGWGTPDVVWERAPPEPVMPDPGSEAEPDQPLSVVPGATESR